MRIPTFVVLAIYCAAPANAQQDCNYFPAGNMRTACLERAEGTITTERFCEVINPGNTHLCWTQMKTFLPPILELYAERERTGWTPPQDGSPWTRYNWQSEFTDRPMAKLSTESAERVDCRDYGDDHTVNLVVSCLEGEMSVEIATQCYLTDSLNGGQMYFRIGSHPAETRIFSINDQNDAIGQWSHEDALSIALQMVDSDQAIFQFTPYDDPLATVRFDLTGFAEEVWSLRDACYW